MATETFSVRMDSKFKKIFKETCENFGLSVSSAINVFANAVVNQKRYHLISLQKKLLRLKMALEVFMIFMNKNKHDMSLDEINRVLYAKKRTVKKH